MIVFENTEVAFRGKSNRDLKRAYWLFKFLAKPGTVKFGKWATNFALKTHLPIDGIIKATIFKQFCGGVSIEDSVKTSRFLSTRNVKSILDYSIEGKTSEVDFEKTVEEIIKTVQQAKHDSNIAFCVFKVTGLVRFEILERANTDLDHLNPEDREAYDKLVDRIDRICHSCHTARIRLFIDAEESWIQNTIDRIVFDMSLKYNREEAIVYNTLQMYRHDRLHFMKEEIQRAQGSNIFLGFKIVRGAYMEKERQRAADLGYSSPIQKDKSATDSDFDAALQLALSHLDRVSVCAGTHNEQSSQFLVDLINQYGVKHDDPRVFFAQLLGMSDHISFNLAENGFLVAKYVPYGPIKEVLPYLIRRAEENTSIAGQTGRELGLIMKELERRKKA